MADSNTNPMGFKRPENKETTEAVKTSVQKQVVEDPTLQQPYLDEKSVTIALVKNFSLYRRANDKVLNARVDYIGSSVTSSRILSSNKIEVETYFPNIVGVAINDPSFVGRVKHYLNNIRIPVDELGRTFNVSFHFNTKADYLKYKEEEEKIEAIFNDTPKNDIVKLREALNQKILRLNALESTKCQLGYPDNVEDYLMYRHCLLYKDIAKDISLINSDPTIRFFFKDNKKEAEKLQKHREQVVRAKQNYVACTADKVLFDAVFIQYCIINNLPILSSLAQDTLTKEIKLDDFSTKEPNKFNKICANKDVKLMATIELLIARGELIRSVYNQNITTTEGDLIGANMIEAVAWFKNPENTQFVNAFQAKLKNI